MEDYNKNLKKFSRDLRKNMTDAERRIWCRIKGKQVPDVQFYRQKILDNFIVDFYCPKAALVVEIDGGQHFEKDAAEADEKRDEKLNELGIKVLRFNNAEVMTNTDGVMACLYEELKKRT
ncbi:endonuclease domain-containing protein [Seleniivibrio woodruffii]|uniref:Very-short-patch-repair endonuclease n=1 Tax=Seleniivibrio woodruffii TaxID=1078050 RepID=A0A4R1KGJ2_9BACT|nr:endonuclease domain-containing protein [Seleniivibrio woodruffii]TCK62459.1 very-short-patch-repair endonuclease [Seleniivibrio woodruffii]TVZ34423.1 very-short-patch-repair endonuclease [Seleniivibrio woodruffii]